MHTFEFRKIQRKLAKVRYSRKYVLFFRETYEFQANLSELRSQVFKEKMNISISLI